MVKKILVDFDDDTFQKLRLAKGDKTWREVILNVLPTNRDEILRDAIFDGFNDAKEKAGLCKREDIFNLIEVLRVVAVRCVNNGVDKSKIIELIDSLVEVR